MYNENPPQLGQSNPYPMFTGRNFRLHQQVVHLVLDLQADMVNMFALPVGGCLNLREEQAVHNSVALAGIHSLAAVAAAGYKAPREAGYHGEVAVEVATRCARMMLAVVAVVGHFAAEDSLAVAMEQSAGDGSLVAAEKLEDNRILVVLKGLLVVGLMGQKSADCPQVSRNGQ